jgi:hypothetical protein
MRFTIALLTAASCFGQGGKARGSELHFGRTRRKLPSADVNGRKAHNLPCDGRGTRLHGRRCSSQVL